MPQAVRARFIEEVNAAHSQAMEAMAEGRPHSRAKGDALDALRLYFSRTGRRIYLAQELSVLYPGQESFVPDILAVRDVEETPDDSRSAWVVADEGKGLDLVIEISHKGNRDKDFIQNVERYAGLGIPEYIIYDCLNQQIHFYRLPSEHARRYQRQRHRFGRHASRVLGLDLAVFEGRVRFFHGPAEVPSSSELIVKLESMLDDLQQRSETAQAEQAQALARAEASLERAEANLQRAILAIARLRGWALSPEAEARILACKDPGLLERWVQRAPVVATLEDLFLDA